MKLLSVEYAHIYTNSEINKEHELSLEILGNILKRGIREKSSLVVMVDDYSFPDPSFDYNSFLKWLTDKGFAPNIVFRESQLIPVCDEVIALIEDRTLKSELLEYVRSKKYPCSLFIATWYLLRLGLLNSPIFDTTQRAERLINILPSSFKPFEDKAIEIIKSTKFKGSVNEIEYKYFDGRKI